MTFTSRRISPEGAERAAALLSAAPLAARGIRGIFGWYRKRKEAKAAEERERRVWRFFRKAGIIAVIVLLCVGGIAVGVKAMISLQIISPQSILNVAGSDLPKDSHGYTNFLLLGVGDVNHDGVDLTDSMMIASIDPKKTHSVTLISIPRDLYIQNARVMGSGRINGLFRSYKWSLINDGTNKSEASMTALHELMDELSRRLDIQIHHAVKVDFTGFVKAVDALGGVDVEVPEDLVDTEYPGPNYSYQVFQIAAGPQHLDGETALKYARSRHSTNDFSRSARQQQILHALSEQARTAGLASSPGKLAAFWKIFSEHVETTMSFRELLGAAKLGDKIDKEHILTFNINDQLGSAGVMAAPGGFLYSPPRNLFGGAAVLLPFALPPDNIGSWHQIRTFVHLLFAERPLYVQRPQIYVINGGAPSGTARLLSNELTRYGFPVSEIMNASDDRKSLLMETEQSLVSVRTEEDKPVSAFFAQLLHLPDGELPLDLETDRIAQLTILLGKDYKYTSMQELIGLPSDAALASSSAAAAAATASASAASRSSLAP